MLAQLQRDDPERWANRLDLMKEVVDRVMDAEMQRAGFIRRDGSRQPLDLPYSYVIHASEDKKGVESPHAHVIVPAMDRDRDRPINVYPKDAQHTREVAQCETEHLFQLQRIRDHQREPDWGTPERTWDQPLDKEWHPSFGGRELDMPDFHGGVAAACSTA
jgi:hypothetical protein